MKEKETSEPGTEGTPDGGVTRRQLFCGACVLALGAAGCGGEGGAEDPQGAIAAGPVSAMAIGALKVMDNVALGRDQQGVYAMSAVCPHARCLTEVRGDG